MDTLYHSHIPYIVILYKAIQFWRSQHNNSDPKSFSDKEAFKQVIKGMAIDFKTEINFEEAVRESYRAYTVKEISQDTLKAIFSIYSSRLNSDGKLALKSDDSNFYFLASALALYLGIQPTSNGEFSIAKPPPLSGAIPDMTSTTEMYVELQRLYQQQAESDAKQLKSLLTDVLATAGRLPNSISEEEVDTFCKNAANLLSLKTSALEDELSGSGNSSSKEIVKDVLENDLFDDPAQTPILWYLALRAADGFYAKYGRWPGDFEAGDEAEESSLLAEDQKEMEELLKRKYEEFEVAHLFDQSPMVSVEEEEDHAGVVSFKTDAYAQEMVRYGGCELHTISAVIGGIASQEAVKVITHQYVPLNNTYIFNGIASCGSTYEL